jgi:ubiquinone/menaquinone biosynthesis C-methylase UbiE
MIKRLWLKYYWLFGYRSRLYDWLTPESYRESMARTLECIGEIPDAVLLDAGCGSGILFDVGAKHLASVKKIIATDILESGIRIARRKILEQGLKMPTFFFRADLTSPLPIKAESVDVAIAHFSLYTIGDNQARHQALKNIQAVLHPGGLCAVINPSEEYDGRQIIQESLQSSLSVDPYWKHWLKKNILYRITYSLGLKNIEVRLKEGVWKKYSTQELCEEMRALGFEIIHTEKVYASSGILVVGRLPA